MGRISYLKSICPKCGEVGGVTYRRGSGFYINHGKKTSHKINDNEPLNLVLDETEDLTFFHYPGGDAALIPYLLKMIPPHNCYVEVFGGSAKLLLSKPRSRVEVYNDIDGNLVNLFRVVKDREKFQKFMEGLDMMLYSRRIYYDMVKKVVNNEGDDVERAVAFFYSLSAGFFGDFGKGFGTSKVRNHAQSFFNKMKMLRKIHRRLRNVVIEDLDFRECIKRYDSSTTFFYLDPPHLYISTEKRDDYYSVGFTDNDYMEMLNLLEKIKGKFLLKQAGAVHYVEDWAKEHGYYTRRLALTKNMVKVKNGEKRPTWIVYLIANYRI
ncbi:MAG: DNA adenine methylase [Ignisphaera sp.]